MPKFDGAWMIFLEIQLFHENLLNLLNLMNRVVDYLHHLGVVVQV